MRDSTIIYRSFYEAIVDLPKENQAEVWAAIFEFSLNFRVIELTGISATIFKLIRPNLEANIKKFENGKKPKQKQKESKAEAKSKQKVSKIEANEDEDKDVNEDKKVIPPLSEFLDYCKLIIPDTYQSLEFPLTTKYETFVSDGWKDGNKKPIKNWKLKIKSVIPYLKPSYSQTPKARIVGVSADEIFGPRTPPPTIG